MEAAPVYHPLEYPNTDGATDTFQIPAPFANKRGGGGRAAQATAHAATGGGTTSPQTPRAQHKRAADPPAPIRCEERPTAGDSHYAPKAVRSVETWAAKVAE